LANITQWLIGILRPRGRLIFLKRQRLPGNVEYWGSILS